MATTPVFLPRESPWQRNLGGYSPCGHKEADTTEQLAQHSTICITDFLLVIFVLSGPSYDC